MIEQWKSLPPKRFKATDLIVKKMRSKRGLELDKKAEKLHNKVFSKIDCLDCANCCSSIPPIVTPTDVNRIAKHLNLSTQSFEDQYTIIDEDGDRVMNQAPCPFLEANNHCKIYDQRPKACRAYPHTDHLEFSKNLNLHATNARYCPAVYEILVRLDHIS